MCVLCAAAASYSDLPDAPETGIAACTMKQFPYMPEHCIEWARQALFDTKFIDYPTLFNTLLTDRASFVTRIRKADDMLVVCVLGSTFFSFSNPYIFRNAWVPMVMTMHE